MSEKYHSLENDLNLQVTRLQERTDSLTDSQCYIAAEYDEIKSKFKEIEKNLNLHSNELNDLGLSINSMSVTQTHEVLKLDALEQYGRRDNLELHGIPEQKNEDTNFLIKKFASQPNLKIDDQQISTSHRLPAPPAMMEDKTNATLKNKTEKNQQARSITAKFARTDVRNQLYKNRVLIPQIPKFDIPDMQYLFIT